MYWPLVMSYHLVNISSQNLGLSGHGMDIDQECKPEVSFHGLVNWEVTMHCISPA